MLQKISKGILLWYLFLGDKLILFKAYWNHVLNTDVVRKGNGHFQQCLKPAGINTQLHRLGGNPVLRTNRSLNILTTQWPTADMQTSAEECLSWKAVHKIVWCWWKSGWVTFLIMSEGIICYRDVPSKFFSHNLITQKILQLNFLFILVAVINQSNKN